MLRELEPIGLVPELECASGLLGEFVKQIAGPHPLIFLMESRVGLENLH